MPIRIKDVMLDIEPIGLAETFAALEDEVTAELEVDEVPAADATVYFGLPLPIEEIAEVKAKVLTSAQSEGGYIVSVKILAVDARLKSMAIKTLTSESSSVPERGAGPMWAKGLRQTNGTYALLVNVPAGLLKAAQLEKIAEIAKKNAGLVKLTHAQRIVILASADTMDSIEAELSKLDLKVGVLHHGVRNIRACCGALCKWAKGIDAISCAIAIDKAVFGMGTNFDVKIAVSDCPRNCSESYCADIGLLGGNGVYDVVMGGRGSQVPFRAVRFAVGVRQEAIPELVTRIVDWYGKTAEPRERLWKTLERLGADEIKNLDFSAIKSSAAGLTDGIDEFERLKSHLARCAGARRARQEMGFTGGGRD